MVMLLVCVRCLVKNTSAVVEIEVDRPVCLELYASCKDLGRFMLRSCGSTIAAGLVTEVRVMRCDRRLLSVTLVVSRQLVNKPVEFMTGQLVDWSTCGLVNLQTENFSNPTTAGQEMAVEQQCVMSVN